MDNLKKLNLPQADLINNEFKVTYKLDEIHEYMTDNRVLTLTIDIETFNLSTIYTKRLKCSLGIYVYSNGSRYLSTAEDFFYKTRHPILEILKCPYNDLPMFINNPESIGEVAIWRLQLTKQYKGTVI